VEYEITEGCSGPTGWNKSSNSQRRQCVSVNARPQQAVLGQRRALGSSLPYCLRGSLENAGDLLAECRYSFGWLWRFEIGISR
jgi:hypothetical protein